MVIYMDKLIGYERDIADNKILSIQINLLNECTSKCRSCRKYTWPKDILNVEDVINVIRYLAINKGLKTVVLSGGDPLLYPKEQLLRIIETCEFFDIKVSMITTLITEDKALLRWLARKLYRIHVSIDDVNWQRYYYIRGVNKFKLVDENVKFIMKIRGQLKQPIRISSTISKMNYYHTMDLYRYAKDNGCHINFYYVHTFDNLYMDDDCVESFKNDLKHIIKFENEDDNVISNARSLLYDLICDEKHTVACRCYVPYISCVINANGDIYPCCRVFKDNGFYGDQLDLAYGNICNKQFYELGEEFDKRLGIYPIQGNNECVECGQRYYDLIQHLDRIKNGRRDPLFI